MRTLALTAAPSTDDEGDARKKKRKTENEALAFLALNAAAYEIYTQHRCCVI